MSERVKKSKQNFSEELSRERVPTNKNINSFGTPTTPACSWSSDKAVDAPTIGQNEGSIKRFLFRCRPLEQRPLLLVLERLGPHAVARDSFLIGCVRPLTAAAACLRPHPPPPRPSSRRVQRR